MSAERSRCVDGATFAFAASTSVPAVWGKGHGVLWAEGEPLMLVGPDGVGKTTLQQQLLLARLGISDSVFGFPVATAARPVLYVAADRPRQAARSLRRMVSEADRAALERLIVWEGPLPFDLTEDPRALADFIAEQGAGDLFIDALKDVALDLVDDRTGSRVNRAFQEVIADGVELCAAHHQRKEQQGSKPKRLADVYGSRWLTAGMGSVVLLWGEPGDSVVQLLHLKQPAEDVGPLKILHEHEHGRSTLYEPTSLEGALALAPHGLTVADAARLLFG